MEHSGGRNRDCEHGLSPGHLCVPWGWSGERNEQQRVKAGGFADCSYGYLRLARGGRRTVAAQGLRCHCAVCSPEPRGSWFPRIINLCFIHNVSDYHALSWLLPTTRWRNHNTATSKHVSMKFVDDQISPVPYIAPDPSDLYRNLVDNHNFSKERSWASPFRSPSHCRMYRKHIGTPSHEPRRAPPPDRNQSKVMPIVAPMEDGYGQ